MRLPDSAKIFNVALRKKVCPPLSYTKALTVYDECKT